MVARRIMLTWLILGVGIGALSAGQTLLVSDRLSGAAFVLVGGVTIGIVGGLTRLLLEWHRGNLNSDRTSRPQPKYSVRLFLGVLVSVLTISGMSAALLDASPAVYVPLFVGATVAGIMSLFLVYLDGLKGRSPRS